jgi:hypothetical protein
MLEIGISSCCLLTHQIAIPYWEHREQVHQNCMYEFISLKVMADKGDTKIKGNNVLKHGEVPEPGVSFTSSLATDHMV